MLQQINACIQSVKKIITDLRPSILDQLGLFPAIEWNVENFQLRTHIKCRLTLPEQPADMDSKRSTAVFRILQEALTNVLLHANATQVTITVELNLPNLVMTIKDNGCGITPADKVKSVGFGLQGMQERALYFGGQVSVISQPGSGTTVYLSIPLS